MYTAISWEEAVRLAHLDRIPLAKICRAVKVELLYRTEAWAWWSDQQLTSAIGLPQFLEPQKLSSDAAQLIDEIRCSTTPPPQCRWALLARINHILNREVLSVGESQGAFHPETWEKLTVEFCNGHREILYRFWVGYERGYRCDVSTTPPRRLRLDCGCELGSASFCHESIDLKEQNLYGD
jgi:hypothetical protein